VIISASWLSRTGEGDGTLNLRGISTVLSLAAFLKGYSLWAKDLIFVISDGYLDGMQAWITEYHGVTQSNIYAEPLRLTSGVIWTALNIDYPGHSFSHLGVFFEGINGRLPNQDLINSFQVISRYTGGVPVILYDHLDPQDFPTRRHELSGVPAWFPDFLKRSEEVNEYAYRAKNILRHIRYQGRGKPSGVHGLLHKFRIDAITLFAVPAPGPHGFHAIGRIVESTLRTTNNLLERLHASFFFYLLVGTSTFLKIGSYLPSAVIIGVSMLFAGLREWVSAGWVHIPEVNMAADEKDKQSPSKAQSRWTRRRRPVLEALYLMIASHLLGLATFYSMTGKSFILHQMAYSIILFSMACALPLLCVLLPQGSTTTTAPLSNILKSFNLCLASAVISVISVLNFSLAALLAISMGLPLCYSSSASKTSARLLRYAVYCFLAFGWLVLRQEEVRKSIVDWEVLGVWFAPFMCTVYAPLMLQGAIVSLLPVS